MLRVHIGQVTLRLPLPMSVLTDLLDSLEDLCAIVLPLFGLPNYAALLRDVAEALDVPRGEPLVMVERGGVLRVSLARMFDK